MKTDRWSVDWLAFLHVALARCRAVDIYPQQIMICEGEGSRRLSFVHGVPGENGLASVNFLQDKRKRRALLEAAGVPVPKGATFTYGAGQDLAADFASRVGFPLALKPALGDNGVDTVLGIRDEEGLLQALKTLATPPEQREHHTQSSYRMMLLDEPKEVDGEVVVPNRYSFLVERHVRGRLYRFVVSDGKIVSGLRCYGSPSDGSVRKVRSLPTGAAPAAADVARRAVEAVPGLFSGAVDVVQPRLVDRRRSPVVVDLHDRLGLWVNSLESKRQVLAVAGQVLSDYACAAGAGLRSPQDGQQDFYVQLQTTDSNALDSFVDRGSGAGLELDLAIPSRDAGLATGRLSGGLDEIVDLVGWAFGSATEEPVVSLLRLESLAPKQM